MSSPARRQVVEGDAAAGGRRRPGARAGGGRALAARSLRLRRGIGDLELGADGGLVGEGEFIGIAVEGGAAAVLVPRCRDAGGLAVALDDQVEHVLEARGAVVGTLEGAVAEPGIGGAALRVVILYDLEIEPGDQGGIGEGRGAVAVLGERAVAVVEAEGAVGGAAEGDVAEAVEGLGGGGPAEARRQ